MNVPSAARAAVLSLLGLLTAALLWRGVVVYQADQRAHAAAALDGPGAGTAQEKAPAPLNEQPKPSLMVHVEGAVQNPGVYTFTQGARVHEAIAAAGGALPDGAPGMLNLAAPLTDGAKVYVYSKAEAEAAKQPAPAAQTASYAGGTGGGAQVQVSLNAASEAELQKVPGIGPVTARAIVEHRTKHGPFQRVDDLVAISGIGPKTLEKLRPHLSL